MRALLQLSAVEYHCGELDQAARDAQRAIQLAHDNGIGAFWASQGLVIAGNSFLLAGDYSRAESYYNEALQLAQGNGSRRLEAMASLMLASLRDKQGRFEEVIAPGRTAFNYYREHGFVSNANKAATLLGRAAVERGSFQEAVRDFEDSLAFGQKSGDLTTVADAQEGLGGAYEQMERFPEALMHFQAASTVAKDLGPGLNGYLALHRASVLGSLGRYSEAKVELKKAKAGVLAESGIAEGIAEVSARLAFYQGRYDEARRFYQKLLESGKTDTSMRVDALTRLGLVQLGSGVSRKASRTVRTASTKPGLRTLC